ncbi:hypothetical protein FA13DRAFT_1896425 [Coprinellus micaceus]|uniref:Uncharacterized protein n=1 Tax=Coprinellus micaceus TaxID=71717 RepID=A0A4Y7SVH1_COPMI|nr:hypothetical protein FA13DRAFT_1896425 [Coprinellus micaceus]
MGATGLEIDTQSPEVGNRCSKIEPKRGELILREVGVGFDKFGDTQTLPARCRDPRRGVGRARVLGSRVLNHLSLREVEEVTPHGCTDAEQKSRRASIEPPRRVQPQAMKGRPPSENRCILWVWGTGLRAWPRGEERKETSTRLAARRHHGTGGPNPSKLHSHTEQSQTEVNVQTSFLCLYVLRPSFAPSSYLCCSPATEGTIKFRPQPERLPWSITLVGVTHHASPSTASATPGLARRSTPPAAPHSTSPRVVFWIAPPRVIASWEPSFGGGYLGWIGGQAEGDVLGCAEVDASRPRGTLYPQPTTPWFNSTVKPNRSPPLQHSPCLFSAPSKPTWNHAPALFDSDVDEIEPISPTLHPHSQSRHRQPSVRRMTASQRASGLRVNRDAGKVVCTTAGHPSHPIPASSGPPTSASRPASPPLSGGAAPFASAPPFAGAELHLPNVHQLDHIPPNPPYSSQATHRRSGKGEMVDGATPCSLGVARESGSLFGRIKGVIREGCGRRTTWLPALSSGTPELPAALLSLFPAFLGESRLPPTLATRASPQVVESLGSPSQTTCRLRRLDDTGHPRRFPTPESRGDRFTPTSVLRTNPQTVLTCVPGTLPPDVNTPTPLSIHRLPTRSFLVAAHAFGTVLSVCQAIRRSSFANAWCGLRRVAEANRPRRLVQGDRELGMAKRGTWELLTEPKCAGTTLGGDNPHSGDAAAIDCRSLRMLPGDPRGTTVSLVWVGVKLAGRVKAVKVPLFHVPLSVMYT